MKQRLAYNGIKEKNWQQINLLAQIGDVIKSKKGFLAKTDKSGKFYKFKKVLYIGNGQWLIKGKKKEVKVTHSKEHGGIERFWEHGWDSELGWIRKPNTSKVEVLNYPTQ